MSIIIVTSSYIRAFPIFKQTPLAKFSLCRIYFDSSYSWLFLPVQFSRKIPPRFTNPSSSEYSSLITGPLFSHQGHPDTHTSTTNRLFFCWASLSCYMERHLTFNTSMITHWPEENHYLSNFTAVTSPLRDSSTATDSSPQQQY